MKWPLAAVVAALMLAGCQSAQPTFDPFLGRTTVPAPGTGQAAPAYAPPQYYQGTPPAGSMPPASVPSAGSYDLGQRVWDTIRGVPQGQPYAPQSGSALAYGRTREAPVRDEGVRLASYEERADEAARRVASMAAKPQAAGVHAPTTHETSIRVPRDNQPLRSPAGPRDVPVPTTRSQDQVVAAAPNSGQLFAPPPVGAPRLTTYNPRTMPTAQTVQPSATSAIGRTSTGRFVTIPRAPAQTPPRRFQPPRRAVEITELPQSRSASDTTRSVVTRSDSRSYLQSRLARPAASAAPSVVAPVAAVEPRAVSRPRASYGHDVEYRWLRGKLEYSRSAQRWKLRYIPIDGDTDQYGGSVEIDNAQALDDLKAGDAVRIEGEIVGHAEGASSYSPSYRVSRVEKLGE